MHSCLSKTLLLLGKISIEKYKFNCFIKIARSAILVKNNARHTIKGNPWR